MILYGVGPYHVQINAINSHPIHPQPNTPHQTSAQQTQRHPPTPSPITRAPSIAHSTPRPLASLLSPRSQRRNQRTTRPTSSLSRSPRRIKRTRTPLPHRHPRNKPRPRHPLTRKCSQTRPHPRQTTPFGRTGTVSQVRQRRRSGVHCAQLLHHRRDVR